ncbi:uncharacterized protein LOC141680749 [Apium graveolens]|uniref:uncharacterized protein LOC141680749 n=1 Tax=Apium graveolens TaxID=4045 RepID=UPI003D7A24B7
MSIEETIGSLKAHEERLHGQVESDCGQLLLTEEEWNKRGKEDKKLLLTWDEWLKCSNKGGHETQYGSRYRGRESPRGVRDKSKVRCFNCSAYAHFVADCRKLKREKSVTPKLKEGKAEVVSNMWYLDNGTSNHMTGQRSKFSVFDENVTGRMNFGDGSVVLIKGRGSIAIKCKNGEERLIKGIM